MDEATVEIKQSKRYHFRLEYITQDVYENFNTGMQWI